MKKNILFLAFTVLFAFVASSTLTSCKTKEGCGLEEKYRAKDTNKRGKSNLWSKKQRKKLKKRGQ
ncbi:MAG: hypothetical protein P1U56_26365 [Saprospiraceae bacterium]|nr:hypothetical protein [Saprospiraceae bacterium]